MWVVLFREGWLGRLTLTLMRISRIPVKRGSMNRFFILTGVMPGTLLDKIASNVAASCVSSFMEIVDLATSQSSVRSPL
jgi:hypothetical protein